MTVLPDQCCAKCLWWSDEAPLSVALKRPAGADSRLGICISRPPVVTADGSTRFPEVYAGRICGEFIGVEDAPGPDGGETVDATVVPFRSAA